MKKFLSLVLALIMTMSLVTISAGATEYKDLTDKDEIQYEEAVAVLNRIGIITGYDDGSFRPETELTRGAAAKIIVSLMIGPEAANALPNTYSPYPDVPAGHTFAGVISYCKTAGYISGYGDGTFKPANSLTGFAFAKMLLGALGYKSDLEGFTGTGWTMNVAKLGNAAGLFNRLNFNGAEAVNREEACQLALNTLKGTMVEYTGGFNIVSGDATIVGNQTRTYVTSNQDYAKNIDNRKAGSEGNAKDDHFTVEFGEEHFKDLRLNDEHELKLDDFGRPSNHWSYKKVTIGVFPIEPDFVYTTQVACKDDAKVTPATKVRALGLNGYKVKADNGVLSQVFVNGKTESLAELADIADYTDNGTVVEVYVDDDQADWIRNVVVVKTQLMEVKKIGSDYVTLDKEDDCEKDPKGFNQAPIMAEVDDVEVEDDYYEFLKGLKAGDKVAVVPLTTDEGASYTVSKAYTPETVTGSLDGSKTFANASVEDKDRGVVEVTVGGTAYKVALWNKDLNNANRDIIKVTKKDVTLLLDEFGNALLAKDIGSTSEYMILGAWRNAVVDGVLVRMATGWDVKGNKISLNVGAEQGSVVQGYDAKGWEPGDVLRYTNDGVTNNAEWKLTKTGVYEVPGNTKVTDKDAYAIKASNSAVALGIDDKANPERKYPITDNLVIKEKGIKTIYVAFDGDEVDYIEIKDGLQNITAKELRVNDPEGTCRRAEGAVKLSSGQVTDKSEVQYVVIKQESNDATLKNLGYVYDIQTTNKRDENNDIISDYKVFTVDEEENHMNSTKNISNRRFVRFNELEEEGMYDLRHYDRRQAGTSVMRAVIDAPGAKSNNNLLLLKSDSYKAMDGTPLGTTDYPMPNISTSGEAGYGTDKVDLTYGDKYADLINIKGAKILDLTSNKVKDADDLKKLMETHTVSVDLAFNDNPDNDEFRLAYIVVITGATKGSSSGGGTVPEGGQELDRGTDTTTLQKALDKGNVTIISGPYDLPGNITIRANTTLGIKGDFNMNGNKITFEKGAKLIVEGTLDKLAQDMYEYATVEAKNVNVTADGKEFGGKMTVSGTLDVATGVTWTVSGTVTVGDKAGSGTTAVTGSGTIKVISTSSLHVFGNVHASTTIQSGDNKQDKNGFVEIQGVMKGTFVDKNVGTVLVQEIQSLEGAAKVELGAESKITTEVFKPNAVELTAGAEITLEKGTDSANLNITDTNGAAVNTGTTETTITIGADANLSNMNDAAANNNVTADADAVSSEPPVKVGAMIIKDKTSYDNLWAAGYKALAAEKLEWAAETGDGKLDSHGIVTMPWLMGLIEVTADIPSGETITAVVTKNGVKIGEQTETVSAETVDKWKAGQKRTFHWEMVDAGADAEYLNLRRGELSGTYTISVNWTVNGQKVAGQEALTTEVSYTEPAIVEAGEGTTLDISGDTIKVLSVIDLTNEENWKIITPGTPSLPLMGEAGKAWFSKDSGFTGAAVIQINNPDGRFCNSLTIKTEKGEEKSDTFANGVTYLILGLKPDAEGASSSFTVTLKPHSTASNEGDVLKYTFNLNYGSADIPAAPAVGG